MTQTVIMLPLIIIGSVIIAIVLVFIFASNIIKCLVKDTYRSWTNRYLQN